MGQESNNFKKRTFVIKLKEIFAYISRAPTTKEINGAIREERRREKLRKKFKLPRYY